MNLEDFYPHKNKFLFITEKELPFIRNLFVVVKRLVQKQNYDTDLAYVPDAVNLSFWRFVNQVVTF